MAADGGGLRLAEYSLVPKLRRVLVAGRPEGEEQRPKGGRPMGCRGEDEPLTSNDDRTVVLSI